MKHLQPIFVFLVALGVLFFTLASVFAETYYVSTNGMWWNTGLSTNESWSFDKLDGLSTIPSNSTVIVLPGVYEETNAQNSTTGPGIRSPYITIKSQVQWGAILKDSTYAGFLVFTNDVTIDGFRITGAYHAGVFGGSEELNNAANLTIRNCWISDCGTNPASGVGPSGIVSGASDGVLCENNLIEHIGNTNNAIYDHGMYLAGNNLTVKNNVIRYCVGAGIQLNDNHPGVFGSSNVLICNNLIYSNGNWGLFLSSDSSNNVSTTVINNTIVNNNMLNTVPYYGASAMALYARAPGVNTLFCSNNILLDTGHTLVVGYYAGGVVINADNNIMALVDYLPTNAHSIVTSSVGFVNPTTGLYWLSSNSVARGSAATLMCLASNFWSKAQSSVVDVGAFQYNVGYNSDARVLDPSAESPTNNYWLDLSWYPPTPWIPTILRVKNPQ